MVHGQAAQNPNTNRVSECLCIHLFNRYEVKTNRPKDIAGKRLPLPQSIVWAYSKIRGLVQNNNSIMTQTDLVLVNISNHTVSTW